MSVTQLHEDGKLVDAPPLLPAGVYQAYYLRHETAYMFKSPKVFVHFKIFDDEYTGIRLYRAYRVKELKGKPRRGGGFKLRHTHELYRQFTTLTQVRERPDRVSLQRLRNCIIKLSVRTVTKDARQRDLIPALQYSVVDRMLSVDAGSINV